MHPLKAPILIVVTLLGTIISIKFSHPANAYEPILVTPVLLNEYVFASCPITNFVPVDKDGLLANTEYNDVGSVKYVLLV